MHDTLSPKVLFKDREEAGEALVPHLKKYCQDESTLLLAIPRGGLPIAHRLSYQLSLPFDIFLSRKISPPDNEELAIGAVSEAGGLYLNEALITTLHLSASIVQKATARAKQELDRRIRCYRHEQALPSLARRKLILIDDGIATGATLTAAVQSLKTFSPQRIVVAAPVATRESILQLKQVADEVICPHLPCPFYSVGQWYQSFPQLSDQEVENYLSSSPLAEREIKK